MKQKLIMALVALALLLSLGVVQVFANYEYLAHSVDLHTNETKVFSNTCEGTHKFGWGRNSSASKHDVWVVVETQSNNGNWIEDQFVRRLLAPGEEFNETLTYVYGNSHVWRVKLDPYSWFKNCTATGFIRNK